MPFYMGAHQLSVVFVDDAVGEMEYQAIGIALDPRKVESIKPYYIYL